MHPLITIIVPVYNIAEHLPRFFDSMAQQTFKDYKMVILDDESKDDSLRICYEYAENDSRIVVVPLKHKGITEVRNIATQYIDTPFTVCADGDDFVEKDYISHLIEAQRKYDSDLVISRVAYCNENTLSIFNEFPIRGEMHIEKKCFPEVLPMLLDDRRLNYVYGKLYRSDFFKSIIISTDVMQGSDTMINCQYIGKIQSITIIDDLDYHYIKYSKRSVTSYNGKNAYERLCRINRSVYFYMSKFNYLNEQMLFVIDGRVLLSAIWVIDMIVSNEGISKEEKVNQISDVLNNQLYLEAYYRQKQNIGEYDFKAIAPQSGAKYLSSHDRKKSWNQIKASILKSSPRSIVNAYHSLKGIKE